MLVVLCSWSLDHLHFRRILFLYDITEFVFLLNRYHNVHTSINRTVWGGASPFLPKQSGHICVYQTNIVHLCLFLCFLCQ